MGSDVAGVCLQTPGRRSVKPRPSADASIGRYTGVVDAGRDRRGTVIDSLRRSYAGGGVEKGEGCGWYA